MASDRMMQAIGALERAVGQLEGQVDDLAKSAPPSPFSPFSSSNIDPAAARAALQSLDTLISELRGNAGG